MSLLFTRPFSVKVPVCRACAPRLRLARLLKMLITLGFVAIGISIALWVLESYDGPARRWLAILIALACCLPFFIWETLFPPPIDITCYSDTVDYEFADSKYADEFADLNGAARTHD